MRKRALVIAALAVLMTGPAAPASAAPPQQVEDPFIFLFADEENGLALFVNITRESFCEWEAGGFVGPPPVEELISAQFNETGKGAIVLSIQQADVSIELWRLDQDVPPFVGACEDTDEQVEPWATGTARIEANDNDLDVSLTRTNSFGNRGQATVYDANGDAWHYSWSLRALITRDGEFRVAAENFNLVK